MEEAPLNTTALLLKTHTSTDGSVSPKPRWCRGLPPTFDEDSSSSAIECCVGKHQAQEGSTTPKTTASNSDEDGDGAPSPPSLRSGDTCDMSSSSNLSSSTTSGKAYHMAWTSLIEDETASEPKLHKPDQDSSPVVLPQLLDSERELLCRNVELRLLEVGRPTTDISVLVDEYLRFMFLRQRLEGMLTLDPSSLVDDVWQAHITSKSEYAAFCERTFGGERLELGTPHREIDSSQPVLYENTFGAYRHFFGVSPPADCWPSPPTLKGGVNLTGLDGEDGQAAARERDENTSGRRPALVRSDEKKFHFTS
eukprot:g13136.t1